VLRPEASFGRDRLDDRHWPFDGQLHPALHNAGFLGELALERLRERLAAVHAAAGKQPVLVTALLVPDQEYPPVPTENRGYSNARFRSHQWADDPKPRTPRSLSVNSSTSTRVTAGTGMTTSWAIRIPGSTVNASCASVLSSTMRSSPRYPESTRPG